MQVKSCFTKQLDAYKAGVEIVEQFDDLCPDVLFLYSSIQYLGSQELLQAIYAEIDEKQAHVSINDRKYPLLIGNTGDGVYANHLVSEIGISCLAMQTPSSVQWQISQQSNLQNDPFTSTVQCFTELLEKCSTTPKFIYIACDFRTDASLILSAIQSVNTTNIPIIGGLAADDYTMQTCFVFANQKVLTDSIVMLACMGDLAFNILLGHSPIATGKPGIITHCESTTIYTINNLPAMDFIENEFGKSLDHVDKGILALQTVNTSQNNSIVRSLILPQDPLDRSVKMFGNLTKGDCVQLSIYPATKMIYDVIDVAKTTKSLSFVPEAAIVVSCAGRKIVLNELIQNEVDFLMHYNAKLQAVAGFPSFGEFANNNFHNMTYVLLLLGKPS